MSLNTYFNTKLLKDSLKMINPVVLTLVIAILVTTAFTIIYFPPGQTVTQSDQINIVKNNNSNPTSQASAGIANALIFVGLTLIGGLLFIILIKYGLDKLMNYILAFTFFIGASLFSFMVLSILLFPVFEYFNLWPILLPLATPFVQLLQIPETASNDYAFIIGIPSLIIGLVYLVGFAYVKNQYLHNTLMITFGVLMGCVFGIFFDSVSLIFVLVALALYDIYAVFRGPLKRMFDTLDMKSERDEIKQTKDFTASGSYSQTTESNANMNNNNNTMQTANNTLTTTKEQQTSIKTPRMVKNPQISRGFTLPVYATPYITIGLGDFAFFSVLISKVTFLAIKGDFLILPATTNGSIYWSLILLPFIGILAGCYLTFVLLQKYEILPALPLPISGGLLGLFLAIILQVVL